jgi:hypothetical protein
MDDAYFFAGLAAEIPKSQNIFLQGIIKEKAALQKQPFSLIK